jgi:hypothetical protein
MDLLETRDWDDRASGVIDVCRARQEIGVVAADASRQLARNRPRRRLIAGGHPRLELRLWIGRDLGCEIAHPVRQAALARRSRKAFLDRPDDPRRAVADQEQRIAKASGVQALKEGPHRLDVFPSGRLRPILERSRRCQ